MNRAEARAEILEAANKQRRARARKGLAGGVGLLPPPFLPRHLQYAVCVCRRNRLVSARVLTTAGFNATERR